MRAPRFAAALAAAALLTACTAEDGGGSPSPSPTPSETAPPTVAFLGDSITSGYGDIDYDAIWPELVAERYGWQMEQFSVAGTGYLAPTADTAFGARVAAVIEAAPDAVVVAGGTNDLLYDQTEVSVAAANVLDDLRTGLPEAQIILTSGFFAPALLQGSTPQGESLDTVMERQTALLRAVAEERGIPFIDTTGLFTETDPSGLILDDGVHPNERGHAVIAEHLGPLLAQHLDG